MNIIGIVGKSGSGKSTLAEMLSNVLDGTHIDFDNVSHQVLKTEEYKKFIKDNFGESVFDGEEIDRKKLGNIVFSDARKLELINKKSETIMETIIDETLAKSPAQYVIIDYALLPKMKYFKMCNFKILVTANLDIRFKRTTLRDKISKKYFDIRDASIDEFNAKDFDFIVKNDGLKADLNTKMLEIAKKIKQMENTNA